MSYKHLNEPPKSQIQILKSKRHKQIEIAQEIGVSPTTMSRELKRNKGLRGYRYQQTHRLATVRISLVDRKV